MGIFVLIVLSIFATALIAIATAVINTYDKDDRIPLITIICLFCIDVIGIVFQSLSLAS